MLGAEWCSQQLWGNRVAFCRKASTTLPTHRLGGKRPGTQPLPKSVGPWHASKILVYMINMWTDRQTNKH